MGGEQSIQKAYESILEHDFEKAIEWFELAIKEEPDNAAYHYKLSITYARSGKLPKALEHAERACELDDAAVEYKYQLQHLKALEHIRSAEKLLEQPNRAELAAALLRQALAMDPLSIEAYVLLAYAYAQQADYMQALDALREALKLHPQHETALKLKEKYKEQWEQDLHSRE